METSCQIAYEFVDQEQLVSYGYLQGPWAGRLCAPQGGYMWERERRRNPITGQGEGGRIAGAPSWGVRVQG